MRRRNGHQSDREKALHRVFKMYTNKGIFLKTEFHDFCAFAKGKSEGVLLSKLQEEYKNA